MKTITSGGQNYPVDSTKCVLIFSEGSIRHGFQVTTLLTFNYILGRKQWRENDQRRMEAVPYLLFHFTDLLFFRITKLANNTK